LAFVDFAETLEGRMAISASLIGWAPSCHRPGNLPRSGLGDSEAPVVLLEIWNQTFRFGLSDSGFFYRWTTIPGFGFGSSPQDCLNGFCNHFSCCRTKADLPGENPDWTLADSAAQGITVALPCGHFKGPREETKKNPG